MIIQLILFEFRYVFLYGEQDELRFIVPFIKNANVTLLTMVSTFFARCMVGDK